MKFIAALFVISSRVTAASAFIPAAGPRTHQHPSHVTLAESTHGLWKVERVDHISDWTDSPKKYPNPLSLKSNVPSSWFVGLNDAVAAKVDVDSLETIEDTCLLSDDYDDINGTGEEDCEMIDRTGLNAEAFVLAGPRAEIAFDPKECKSGELAFVQ